MTLNHLGCSDVTTLAPDDIVRTPAEAAANSREPLLVMEPLLAFLRQNGLEAPAGLDAVPVGTGLAI